MGFEPNEEIVEKDKLDNKFEGGGVDMDSGDLADASPVKAPKRTMRERHAVRARAVNASGQAEKGAAGAAQSGRRAGATGAAGAPPVRKPLMRSNSEFGYLFSDSEPVDNHMDEQYSHRLDALAYDGKKRGGESEYAELFEGQQSMVRLPENRMSAQPQPRPASPAAEEQPSHSSRRPKFSRRNREESSAAAYAAANEVSAAELAAKAENAQPVSAAPAPEHHPAHDGYPYDRRGDERYPREEDHYYRDGRYNEYDYYDDYDYDYRDRRSRRQAGPYGGYEGQPDYPPYGQYPAYPPNYPYPYPYGQYPAYPPYGQYPAYPPGYGYPPMAYLPGYGYPAQAGAVPGETTEQPTAPVQEPVEPVYAAPAPVEEPAPPVVMPVFVPAEPQPEPEKVIEFPDDSSDSVDEEFAGLDAASAPAEPEQSAPAQEEKTPAQTGDEFPARSSGSSRFNRRSRSAGDSAHESAPERSAAPVGKPAEPPAEKPAAQDEWDMGPSSRRRSRRSAEAIDWSDTSGSASGGSTDWFSGDETTTDISKAAGSSRFNRRSRS